MHAEQSRIVVRNSLHTQPFKGPQHVFPRRFTRARARSVQLGIFPTRLAQSTALKAPAAVHRVGLDPSVADLCTAVAVAGPLHTTAPGKQHERPLARALPHV
jgi:hypothetical protein